MKFYGPVCFELQSAVSRLKKRGPSACGLVDRRDSHGTKKTKECFRLKFLGRSRRSGQDGKLCCWPAIYVHGLQGRRDRSTRDVPSQHQKTRMNKKHTHTHRERDIAIRSRSDSDANYLPVEHRGALKLSGESGVTFSTPRHNLPELMTRASSTGCGAKANMCLPFRQRRHTPDASCRKPKRRTSAPFSSV